MKNCSSLLISILSLIVTLLSVSCLSNEKSASAPSSIATASVSPSPITSKSSQTSPIAAITREIMTEENQLPPTTDATSTAGNESTNILVEPTSVATVVLTPSPTATQIFSPTATLILTAWPTLMAQDAINKVITLLQDNHNPDCLLPCWWGAVPGQTNWHDIAPYLKSFAIEVDSSSEGIAFASFLVPESVYYTEKLNMAYGIDESGEITDIWISSVNIEGYDPKTMMTLYGVPDEVWIMTFREMVQGNVLPFHLIIVYQEQGISFHYYIDASRIGENVTACFEPGTVEIDRPELFPVSPEIHLWKSVQHKAIEEIVNAAPLETYYPLEGKTDLTPQTFYEKFTNSNESPCIDTPADLWSY